MEQLKDRIAVVTGAGSGIGRSLAQALVAEGCHIALCDVNDAGLQETVRLCLGSNPYGVRVTGTVCDVADAGEVSCFADQVCELHTTTFINLLINNAGISGGGSFVNASAAEWERTFDICWGGVYHMTRSFLPLLMESSEGHVVNVSSANGIRAVLGGHVPHTAYSAAKFAVRGFSESLIHDFRFNAPHLGVSVVMPGHTGTGIIENSLEVLGHGQPEQWDEQQVQSAKERWQIAGVEGVAQMTEDQLRRQGRKEIEDLLETGMPPATAAETILEGVKSNTWRILIGADTQTLDQLVREDPEAAYDEDFVLRWRAAYAKATMT